MQSIMMTDHKATKIKPLTKNRLHKMLVETHHTRYKYKNLLEEGKKGIRTSLIENANSNQVLSKRKSPKATRKSNSMATAKSINHI